MSLCYIIIIILSAYNVTNKAEQCPKKSILIIICDWILEKRSKSHIRSFEINGFKELKPA